MSGAKSSGAIPSLDGIRAVSILIVFVAHLGYDNIVPGGLGVTVFFFLSGYLITTLLRRELAKNGAISLPQFYLRRVLRILPPLYLIVGGATLLAVVGIINSPIELKAVLAQALQFTNYFAIINGSDGGIVPGSSVLWSLAVEEHYYLIFPLVFAGLSRSKLTRHSQAAVLLLAIAVGLCWRIWLQQHGALTVRTYTATDTRFGSILWGCVLALWHNPAEDMAEATSAERRNWLWIGLPIGAILMVLSLSFRSEFFRETFRYDLQGLALVPLFVGAVRWPEFGPFRLLNSWAAVWLGRLSYSLYLVHHIVIEQLVLKLPEAHPLIIGTLAMVISLAVALVVYHFVDLPLGKLRTSLHKPAKTRQTPTDSSTSMSGIVE